jgi:hypothetical protein
MMIFVILYLVILLCTQIPIINFWQDCFFCYKAATDQYEQTIA